MLAPMAQITCMDVHARPPASAIPPGARLHAVAMTMISTAMSKTPRVEQEPGQLAAALSSHHEAGTGAGQQHEHRRAEVA